jgi:hypothetical protein
VLVRPRLLKSPWRPSGAEAYPSLDTKPEGQAIRSVIRMTETTLPSLNACSLCVLVAGPAEILLCGEDLTFLIDPHLAFEYMAHHRIRHRRTSGLRSRTLAIVAHHYARPGACILPRKGVRRLRTSRADHGTRAAAKPIFNADLRSTFFIDLLPKTPRSWLHHRPEWAR